MNCNPLAHTQFVLEIFFYQAGLFKLVKMNLFLRHYNGVSATRLEQKLKRLLPV